jgi:signal transduction histidine kinase
VAEPARLRAWLLTVLPYSLLAFLTAITVAIKHDAWGSLRIDLALCGLASVWMLVMFTLRPAQWEKPAAMAAFVTGLVAITAVLVVRDSWFGFFVVALYLYAFRLLSWPGRLAGVVAVAVIAGTAQASGVYKGTVVGALAYLAIVAVNVLPMVGLAWFIWRDDQQAEVRQRALAELGQANRRLSASLAENAALQERLVAQARLAGVTEERQRMAREIHDTLAQALVGIITQLQAAEQAATEPDRSRRHVAAATDLARESLVEARRSVHALRPEPLAEATLAEALADVAERWSARNGIPVTITITGDARPMTPEAESALLRTAQEALANVARHAGATRVGVTLSYLSDEAALDVRDDGRGFDPAAGAGPRPPGVPAPSPARAEVPVSRGFGLVAMRQRIEGLAGTLDVESEPGAGTAISARVPTAPARAVA